MYHFISPHFHSIATACLFFLVVPLEACFLAATVLGESFMGQ